MAGGCAFQANPHIVQPHVLAVPRKLKIRRGTGSRLAGAERLKHEAGFKNAARLVHARTRCAESESGCRVRRVDNCKVAPQEERVFTIRRGNSESESSAACTIE